MIILFVLHAAALPRGLLPKHRTKDQDILIKQSLFAFISKSMALPYKKLTNKNNKKFKN